MEEKDLNRDSAAQKMYGHPYDNLSAWGRQHVDEVIMKMGKIDAPWNSTLKSGNDSARLVEANEQLSRDNEQLRIENGDLWEENSTLQGEIAELQAKWNPKDS